MENHGSDQHFRWYKISLRDHTNTLTDFYFRGLTAQEKRTYFKRADKNKADADLYILQTCVTNDTDWDHCVIGTINRLLEEIQRVSGLVSDPEELPVLAVRASEYLATPIGAQEAAAVMTIPSLTWEKLHTSDPWYYFLYLLVGQFSFTAMFGKPPEDIFNPKEEEEGGQLKTFDSSNIQLQPGQTTMVPTEQFVFKSKR